MPSLTADNHRIVFNRLIDHDAEKVSATERDRGNFPAVLLQAIKHSISGAIAGLCVVDVSKSKHFLKTIALYFHTKNTLKSRQTPLLN